ncbi:MAG: class I SAM-dependent methyltransferase [Oscillospiraceae bacterium]|nr:class I SAM-dependent methyltransferase [Oscillospiraceae bacterium]MDD4414194.1 class I SAM-dependent methyltransferase [Oscillospiraceae bacterium]
MRGYTAFAGFYDRLMYDVDYKARARYLLSLFKLHLPHKPPHALLDLGCGSGSLALELCALGIDVIGVDGSADMLSVASDKANKSDVPLMLLCQDMRELDLFGTVDGAVCTLDSLNHLCSTDELAEVFNRLFLFIEPGGLFIFDVNTVYKHRFVLGDNSFVYEQDDFLCIWRNRLISRTAQVDMQLDFFVKQGNGYTRLTDSLRERAYSEKMLKKLLTKAGFETLSVYDDMTTECIKDNTQRMVFVTKRSL